MTTINVIKKLELEINNTIRQINSAYSDKAYYRTDDNGNIVQLGLRNSRITNPEILSPYINELRFLQVLDLGENKLSDLHCLSNLLMLKQLILDKNNFSSVGFLREANSLRMLDLSFNAISNSSDLKHLVDLRYLNLNFSGISDISFLETLQDLQVLHLSANNIADISHLKNLDRLKELGLNRNRITNLKEIGHLSSLQLLDLGFNLIHDISPLKELKNLSRLILSKNPIMDLPKWVIRLPMTLRWERHGDEKNSVYFFDNLLGSIPAEIKSKGREVIENYFRQLQNQEEDYLLEAKLLILGQPGAGKTSLARKLENSDCDLPRDEETTRGIEVRQLSFPLQDKDVAKFEDFKDLKDKLFRLNVWDFGTQEIYSTTHRFFLSKRSLYIVLADSRNEDSKVQYWLQTVNMFTGNSPVIIVLNEKYQRKCTAIDTNLMGQRFRNIKDEKALDLDDKNKDRLNILKDRIKELVIQLPHIGNTIPSKWKTIRELLITDSRNTMPISDYLHICHKNDIKDLREALVLSQYFHDIGVFLHFQDDEVLNKTIFLKPNWATNSVYKILDSEIVNETNGRFNKMDAEAIWSDDEFLLIRSDLLRLMQRFFLTYEIESSGKFIVPEKLQPTQPPLKWDDTDNLQLKYVYEFMPYGIISQFIVSMNRYITNQKLVWKKGVVLEREVTQAEVIEKYDDKIISIRIAGRHKSEFMTIITEQIDIINNQFEKLNVRKLVPCNCLTCKNNSLRHFYAYDKLKYFLEHGKKEVECELSPFHKSDITTLLREVFRKHTPRTKLFVSYSHKDKSWLKKIEDHLKALKQITPLCDYWVDTSIKSGMEWKDEIREALASAKVILLLISTNFIASKFINEYELEESLKAAANEGATIIPLIVDHCIFKEHGKLSHLQAENDPDKPLSSLRSHEVTRTLVQLTIRIKSLFEIY